MSADVLAFPLGGMPRQLVQGGREQTAPARQIVKVVGFDLAVGQDEDALHQLRARDNRLRSAFDLADVRLGAAKLGRNPFLGLALLLPPHCQLHETLSPSERTRYFDGLYFVNGHKEVLGAEYKQMAYLYAMHPGNRIRELRKAAGLSQTDLAQRTGVSQPYISQIENQDGLSLDIARMRVLAREFKCTPADLLADSDNPDRLEDDERQLLALFRAASASQKELIFRVAQPLGEVEQSDRRAAA
jgi:transcriptional regulator with XRE-family HTH domain